MLGILLFSLVGAVGMATLIVDTDQNDETPDEEDQFADDHEMSVAPSVAAIGPYATESLEPSQAASIEASEDAPTTEFAPQTADVDETLETVEATVAQADTAADTDDAQSDGETIALTITPEMIRYIEANGSDSPMAYATHIDLTDPKDQFECDLPKDVDGKFFLIEYTQEEPTGDDYSVEVSQHLELIYSPSGETPSQNELMGLSETETYILAHIDLGHVLMDTDSRDFLNGHINESPALSPQLAQLERINVYL